MLQIGKSVLSQVHVELSRRLIHKSTEGLNLCRSRSQHLYFRTIPNLLTFSVFGYCNQAPLNFMISCIPLLSPCDGQNSINHPINNPINSPIAYPTEYPFNISLIIGFTTLCSSLGSNLPCRRVGIW